MNSPREHAITTEMLATQPAETATAAALGAALASPLRLSTGIAGTVLPDGYTLQSLERYDPAPSAKRGALTFNDVESLARYVNTHKDLRTAIFWDRAPSLVAVLDHHAMAADGAGWGRHTAALKFTRSRAWQAWAEANGKQMTQAAFAEFVEDHLDDIASPAGAELLELARRFGVSRAVTFESAVNLTNGNTQLTYAEADATKGNVQIPPTLILGLAPFDGDHLFRVEARLRYRIEAGKLTLTIKLVRPEDVTDQAVAARVAELGKATDIAPYFGLAGAPPAAL